LQAWALNRYYYQSRIPIKDAAILARSEDPAFRLAGANVFLITMATARNPAASKNGYAWWRPPAFHANKR